MSDVRVRFAPSPTGQVHIGNIRAAIFNWLYARHEGGTFLLRIEDTDLERSTPEAIRTLLDVMQWLKLDYDEEIVYQTKQLPRHLAAVEKLLAQGDAYRENKGGKGEAVIFRIPWDASRVPGMAAVGPAELPVHPDTPVTISSHGVDFASISAKGKSGPGGACLAGFHDLKVWDASGNCLFALNDHLPQVQAGESFSCTNAVKLTFTRYVIRYQDIVKGEMTKPLDSMKDVLIVRSDGSPVFHVANVVDDITQRVTHIIRGDDHVENTFKHIMLFACLGEKPPQYAHLPMIVNAAGKPYSKRDGDAFVGDFRTKGYLAEALVNYLTLLGWAPTDGREKMTREERVAAFSLERCQRGAAQMDMRKLTNLNGQYMAEMPPEDFFLSCAERVREFDWGRDASDARIREVCALMHSRLKTYAEIAAWCYFFQDIPVYDAAVCAKQFKDANAVAALKSAMQAMEALPEFTQEGLEKAVQEAEAAFGIGHGKLNQPLRAAVTGTNIGAGIFETMMLLGRETCLKRMHYCMETQLPG